MTFLEYKRTILALREYVQIIQVAGYTCRIGFRDFIHSDSGTRAGLREIPHLVSRLGLKV